MISASFARRPEQVRGDYDRAARKIEPPLRLVRVVKMTNRVMSGAARQTSSRDDEIDAAEREAAFADGKATSRRRVENGLRPDGLDHDRSQ